MQTQPVSSNFFANEADIARLQTAVLTDTYTKGQYNLLLYDREKQLGVEFFTEAYANSVYTQHGLFYEVGEQLDELTRVLCPLFLLDGDRSAGEKLKAALSHFTAFAAWTGPQNKDKEIPWHSDLSTTRISVALAYAYDTVFDILTEEERVLYAQKILHLGILPLLADWVLPETRIHALDSMGHNWWSVCIGLAGVALLPLKRVMDQSLFVSYITAIEQALIDFLRYPGCTLFNKVPNYDEKGLFYESVCYFNYGTGELLSYLYHAERYLCRRQALRDALPNGLGEAILSFSYPIRKDGKTVYRFLDYGDSAYNIDIFKLASYLTLCGFTSPALEDYLSTTHPKAQLLTLLGPIGRTENAARNLPLTAVYPASGYAVCRDSWQDDATLLCIKSGYTWNHAHADAGSFVLYAKGEPLFIDSGTCPYGDPLYRTYYTRDIAHNVLRIGNDGQRDEDILRGSKFPCKIADHFMADGLFYAQADATGAVSHLCSRMYRNYIWLENRILLLLDDVYCLQNSTVDFLLHYNGTLQKNADSATYTLTGAKETAQIYCLGEEPETDSREIGHPSHAPTKEQEYLILHTETSARAHLLAHAICLGEEQPLITSATEADGLRISICGRETTYTVYFNRTADGRRMHINSNASFGGIETDAYILLIKEQGGKAEAFYVCASYLRRGETVFFSDFSKKTGLVSLQ